MKPNTYTLFILVLNSIFLFVPSLIYNQSAANQVTPPPEEINHTIILLTLRGDPPYGGSFRSVLADVFERMVKKICLEGQPFSNNRPLIGNTDYYSFLGSGLHRNSDLDSLIEKSGFFFTHHQGNAAVDLNNIVQTLKSKNPFNNYAYPGLAFAQSEALIKSEKLPNPVAHTYVIWVGIGEETHQNPSITYNDPYLKANNITGIEAVDKRRIALNKILDFNKILDEGEFFKSSTFNPYGIWVNVFEVQVKETFTPKSYLTIRSNDDFQLTRQQGEVGWKNNLTLGLDTSILYQPYFIQGLLISKDNKDTTVVPVAAEELSKEKIELSFFSSHEPKGARIELKCWTKVNDGYYNSLLVAPQKDNERATTISLDAKVKAVTPVLFSKSLAEKLFLAIPISNSQATHGSISNVLGVLLILLLLFLIWRYLISLLIAYYG